MWFALSALIALPLAIQGLTISLPSSASSSAATVSANFPNIGFETFSVYNFLCTSATDTSPNQFSINLLSSIFQRTGGQPIFRVGGASGDYYTYNPSQSAALSMIPTSSTPQSNFVKIGPSFWPLTKNFASLNAQWIPQISLANLNQTQVNEQAQAIVSGIGYSNIVSIELGNEPSLFANPPPTGYSPPLKNNSQYVPRYNAVAKAVVAAINPPRPIMQFADFLDIHAFSASNIPGSIQAGLDTSIVNAAGVHYYELFVSGTWNSLLNNTLMIHQLAPTLQAVQYLQANNPSIKLRISEANVKTGGVGAFNLQNSLASAIWRANFMLYCMSIGVASVNIENVFGSIQSMWVPFTSGSVPQGVNAGFYAFPTVAEFIGNGGGSLMQPLTVPGISTDIFAAYAAYTKGSTSGPTRVALANLEVWDQSFGTQRPSQSVTLTGLKSGSNLQVRYLTAPSGANATAATMSWANGQWTAASNGKEVAYSNTSTSVPISGGQATVTIPATSIAICQVLS